MCCPVNRMSKQPLFGNDKPPLCHHPPPYVWAQLPTQLSWSRSLRVGIMTICNWDALYHTLCWTSFHYGLWMSPLVWRGHCWTRRWSMCNQHLVQPDSRKNEIYPSFLTFGHHITFWQNLEIVVHRHVDLIVEVLENYVELVVSFQSELVKNFKAEPKFA